MGRDSDVVSTKILEKTCWDGYNNYLILTLKIMLEKGCFVEKKVRQQERP